LQNDVCKETHVLFNLPFTAVSDLCLNLPIRVHWLVPQHYNGTRAFLLIFISLIWHRSLKYFTHIRVHVWIHSFKSFRALIFVSRSIYTAICIVIVRSPQLALEFLREHFIWSAIRSYVWIVKYFIATSNEISLKHYNLTIYSNPDWNHVCRNISTISDTIRTASCKNTSKIKLSANSLPARLTVFITEKLWLFWTLKKYWLSCFCVWILGHIFSCVENEQDLVTDNVTGEMLLLFYVISF
jgi:hypothetical protein